MNVLIDEDLVASVIFGIIIFGAICFALGSWSRSVSTRLMPLSALPLNRTLQVIHYQEREGSFLAFVCDEERWQLYACSGPVGTEPPPRFRMIGKFPYRAECMEVPDYSETDSW